MFKPKIWETDLETDGEAASQAPDKNTQLLMDFQVLFSIHLPLSKSLKGKGLRLWNRGECTYQKTLCNYCKGSNCLDDTESATGLPLLNALDLKLISEVGSQ